MNEDPAMEGLLELRSRLIAGTADEDERARFAALAGKLEHAESLGLLERLLEDSDPVVRYNALRSILFGLGRRDAAAVETCRRLFAEDEDLHVRRLALTGIGSAAEGGGALVLFSWIEGLLRSRELEPALLETA